VTDGRTDGQTVLTILYLFVTIHVCDRRTDRQTEFSSLDRVCIPCSAVKRVNFLLAHSV